jgi:hypothetical protein
LGKLDLVEPDINLTHLEAGLFTLEPHIRLISGSYGFKHENIYYFEDETLHEL